MAALVLILVGGVVGFLAGCATAGEDGSWHSGGFRLHTPGRITRKEPWEIPELLDYDRR